jgi:hypothetical protein
MSSEMVSNLAVMKNMYYLSPVSHWHVKVVKGA